MLVRITRECLIEGKTYRKGQVVEVEKFVGVCMEKVEDKKKEKEEEKREEKKTKKGGKK